MSDETPAGTAHSRIDELERKVSRLWLEVGALAMCLLALAVLHGLRGRGVG